MNQIHGAVRPRDGGLQLRADRRDGEYPPPRRQNATLLSPTRSRVKDQNVLVGPHGLVKALDSAVLRVCAGISLRCEDDACSRSGRLRERDACEPVRGLPEQKICHVRFE